MVVAHSVHNLCNAAIDSLLLCNTISQTNAVTSTTDHNRHENVSICIDKEHVTVWLILYDWQVIERNALKENYSNKCLAPLMKTQQKQTKSIL